MSKMVSQLTALLSLPFASAHRSAPPPHHDAFSLRAQVTSAGAHNGEPYAVKMMRPSVCRPARRQIRLTTREKCRGAVRPVRTTGRRSPPARASSKTASVYPAS